MLPKVLVIQDDKFLAKIYQLKLPKEGFDVTLAHNGEEGLALMREQKPDIILLDLIMPIMDGFTVLERMHADPELKTIKVLVTTNLAQEEDQRRCLALGAIGFVVKAETRITDLVTVMHKHLAS